MDGDRCLETNHRRSHSRRHLSEQKYRVSPPIRSTGALAGETYVPQTGSRSSLTPTSRSRGGRTVDTLVARALEHTLRQTPHRADDSQDQQELEQAKYHR